MSTSPATSPRTLQRSVNNRVIAGVCSGLANYFAIDPILVRLAFIVVAFAGGASILAYIILWIVVPPGEGSTVHAALSGSTQGAIWVGGFLIFLGVLFLAGNTGLFWWWSWNLFWPLILVGLGVLILSRRVGGH
jgi:phage shock protein PspC (stress-responsive transcriptional regulator)